MKRMVLIPEERLLQYERQQRDPVSNNTEHNQYEEKGGSVQNGSGEEKRELSDDIIVRGIPKTMRTRALALLERLKARPDVISWDDMGQVKIDGTLIPKSNISDLISSAMRSRKHFDPVASREFFGVLSDLNVPKDLVRNEEGWRRVTRKGEGNQRGKGVLMSPGPYYQPEETPWKGMGLGKLRESQEGGFAFGPYTQGLSGIEKKRRAPQKGGRLRKIPNWECYKG